MGVSAQRVSGIHTPFPVDRILDTCLWKHYLFRNFVCGRWKQIDVDTDDHYKTVVRISDKPENEQGFLNFTEGVSNPLGISLVTITDDSKITLKSKLVPRTGYVFNHEFWGVLVLLKFCGAPENWKFRRHRKWSLNRQSECKNNKNCRTHSPKNQRCTRVPEFVQNFSERQILWSLCSIVFHALTLKLPIQTSLSVAHKLPVFTCSGEKCEISAKRALLPWGVQCCWSSKILQFVSLYHKNSLKNFFKKKVLSTIPKALCFVCIKSFLLFSQ